MTLPPRYVETDSRQIGRVRAVGTGPAELVIAATDGVRIVTDSGVVDGGLAGATDVAVGEHVYVVVDDGVTALLPNGAAKWTADLTGVVSVTALPDGGAAVLTDEKIVRLDTDGSERDRWDRPYTDVAGTHRLVAVGERLVVTAWSMLAVVEDGETVVETTLDGSIQSVTVVDGTAVVSLKSGTVVGVETADGSVSWEASLNTDRLASGDDDRSFLVVDDELVALSADGDTEVIGAITADAGYATADGSLLAVIVDGSLKIARRSEDVTVTASVTDEALAPDADRVTVTFHNEGSKTAATTIGISAEGAQLVGDDRQLVLGPDERRRLSFPIGSVTADSVTFELTEGSTTLADATLPVREQTGRVHVESTVETITDGVVETTVTVTNRSDTRLSGVTIEPAGSRLGPLSSGESDTVTVESRIGDGPPVLTGDGDEPTPVTELPEPPIRVQIERVGDFVDVRLANATDALVTDDVTVTGGPFETPIDRRVELPASSRVVFVLRPTAADGTTVSVDLDGIGRSETVELRSVPEPATAESSSPATTGRADGATGGQLGGNSATDGQFDDEPATGEEHEGEPATDEQPETEQIVPDQFPDVGATSSLSVRRAVTTDTPAVGQAFTERLWLTNEGPVPVTGVTVQTGDETCRIEAEIRPDETVTVDRPHAVRVPGRWTLDAGTVTVEDGELAVEPMEVTVTDDDVAVTGDLHVRATGSAFEVTVHNGRDDPITIDRVRYAGPDAGSFTPDEGSITLASGETRTLSGPGPSSVSLGTPVKLGVDYVADDEEHTFPTLTPVMDTERPAGLVFGVSDQSEPTGVGTVSLDVRNTGDAPVTEFSLTATGDAVADMFYEPLESGQLAPDESTTHQIDVQTEGTRSLSIPVELSATVDGESVTERLVVSGPSGAAWNPDAVTEWTVEFDSEPVDVEHVTGPFTTE